MADPSESEPHEPEPAPEPGAPDRWLAPLILCGIAISQLVLAHSVGLSPWKGGGFGMFASVDSPSMRIVTAEGLDESGRRVEVDAYDIMSKSDRLRWRSWPKSALLEKLADRIGALSYVESGTQRDRALERFRKENPDLELPEAGEEPGAWVRPWRAGDPEDTGTALKAVRVEGWKMIYLPGENRVVIEALGEPVERGDWR